MKPLEKCFVRYSKTCCSLLWERISPVIAKIIEALSGIMERSPAELIEMLMQSHEFTKRFEWLFIAIEQHFQYPREIA
jgi:hypothetical protein